MDGLVHPAGRQGVGKAQEALEGAIDAEPRAGGDVHAIAPRGGGQGRGDRLRQLRPDRQPAGRKVDAPVGQALSQHPSQVGPALPQHGAAPRVRTGIEVAALAAGWLLGGTVGLGTVLYAVTVGRLVHVFLPLFTVKADTAREPAAVNP